MNNYRTCLELKYGLPALSKFLFEKFQLHFREAEDDLSPDQVARRDKRIA
jgi:hypothetical protein